MNPRETMFEEFVDEFEIEQAYPLDFTGYVHVDEIVEESVRLSGYFKDPLCLYNRYKMGRSIGTQQLAKISRLPTNAEIGYCFKMVPDVYFRSDFSAKHTDIVHAILALEDKEQSSARLTAASPGGNGSDVNVDTGKEGESVRVGDRNEQGENGRRSGDPPVAVGRGVGGGAGGEDKLSEARLTTYLDLVEVALLRQIMSKSPAFFRALDDIHNLQSMVSRAATRIMHIRRELRGFDNEIVAGPLRIPRLDQRRANELLLHEKLLYMQRVCLCSCGCPSLFIVWMVKMSLPCVPTVPIFILLFDMMWYV
jgi:hypothetical protein